VRCPICKRESVKHGNPFRPFCTERCKLIDLDNWLSGRYRVSRPAHEQESTESEKPPESEFGKHDVTAGEE
jgi:uncharacterized protein